MTESDEAASMTVTPRVLRTPELTGNLRAHSVRLPEAAQEASGIRVLGRTIRSIVYTTDIAIIRNCDADAVFAVYPFTPQQIISKAIMEASAIPVFAGVGGGTTAGPRRRGRWRVWRRAQCSGELHHARDGEPRHRHSGDRDSRRCR